MRVLGHRGDHRRFRPALVDRGGLELPRLEHVPVLKVPGIRGQRKRRAQVPCEAPLHPRPGPAVHRIHGWDRGRHLPQGIRERQPSPAGQLDRKSTRLNSSHRDLHSFPTRRSSDLFPLDQAQRYIEFMAGTADVICLKAFANGNPVVQASYGNHKTTKRVTFGGTNQYFLKANQFEIGTGRNFTPEDMDLVRPVAIIGQDIITKLFPSENPMGKLIKANERTYTVIGTFASKGTMFGSSEDNIIMIPITRFLMDFGAEKYSVNIATEAPSQQVYNATMEKGITAMRVARGLRPEQDNDFEIYSNDTLIAAFAKVADVISSGALIISAIALLAAGVGIMNIMLVSVTERTKEIGVRKAVGARKILILTQFLVESVVLSV